ncbi:MAG: hypothetical protein H6Q04_1102 [Acidobacteria bacterium]|nr:hypothetical protein [Acidobacteriota bacterium]
MEKTMGVLARFFYRWENWLSRRDTNKRTRPFEWGLEFLEKNPANADPRQCLIEYAQCVLANSDEYHSYKAVEDYRLEGNHLKYSSPLPTIYPKNNTVHARFFPVASEGRVVLVLPQWNADVRSHISLCRMLNYFDISALRLSLPYHDFRMPEELVRADYMLSANLGRTLQAIRQAVVDCRAAIDWLASMGYTKFGILGTSIGSCVGLITLAHECRLTLGVQNHVSPYVADVVWFGISTRQVRKGLEGHISLEDLRQIWMPISPQAYFKKMVGAGKNSLLVHALYDYSFLPHLSRQVLQEYKELGLTHSVLALPCGHYTSGEFPFNIKLGYGMCSYISKNL